MRFLTLLSLACVPPLLATAQPKAGPPRVLAVASNKNGNWDIYLVPAETGEAKNLTDHRASDTEPVWSPDGTRIAFVSDRDGAPEVWLMKPDGTDPQQVTTKSGGPSNLRWSPDAARIAFVSPKSGKDNVYVVALESGKIVQFTDHPTPSRQPAWAPDGKKLSYTTIAGRWYGHLVSADGTGDQRIPGPGAVDMAFSPDGTRIAFTDQRDASGWRLFVMDADGKNTKLLNKNGNTFGNIYPRWSPDGKTISYGEMVDGVAQVGVIAADGTGAKVITSGHTHFHTRWAPDGKSLAYCRMERGKPIVLVVSDPDGQNAKDLLSGVAPAPGEWKPK